MQTTDEVPAAANLQVEIVGRRVFCPRDVFRWERSEAFADLMAFAERMNFVAGTGNEKGTGTINVDRAVEVLRYVEGWMEMFTGNDFPTAQKFVEFHQVLHTKGHALLVRTYGRPGDHRTIELPAYLEKSFGDPVAGTYGPENELSFCMYLVALFKLHHLTCEDEPYIVTVLFDRYLDVVDHLIKSYRLAPSVKYGDWGLDDYRFVAFLWGSAQMTGNEGRHGLSPATALADVDVARRLRTRYVLMKCMDTVHRRANPEDNEQELEEREERHQRPFWSYSYQLWNLTAFTRWDRVNGCLMAAFQKDILGRFEIVRHLIFGELLRFNRNPRPPGMSFYDCIPLVVTKIMKSLNRRDVCEDEGRDIIEPATGTESQQYSAEELFE